MFCPYPQLSTVIKWVLPVRVYGKVTLWNHFISSTTFPLATFLPVALAQTLLWCVLHNIYLGDSDTLQWQQVEETLTVH